MIKINCAEDGGVNGRDRKHAGDMHRSVAVLREPARLLPREKVVMLHEAVVDASADLSAFKARGGKLLLYHGWSDGIITPLNTIDYYERVLKTMGPEAGRLDAVVHGAGNVTLRRRGRSGSDPLTGRARALARDRCCTRKDPRSLGERPSGGHDPSVVPVPAHRYLDRHGEHQRRRQLYVRGSVKEPLSSFPPSG